MQRVTNQDFWTLLLDYGSGQNPRSGKYLTCDVRGRTHITTDGYNIYLPNNSVRLIRVRNVLHHIKDLERLGYEFARILKLDGCLVVIEPHADAYAVNVLHDCFWTKIRGGWYSPIYRDYADLMPFEIKKRIRREEKEITCFQKLMPIAQNVEPMQ